MRDSGLSCCATGVAVGKLRLIDQYLSAGRTLDVGCGNGLYGLYMEAHGTEVVQIDVEDRRDARARHLPLRLMDAQRLTFADNMFANVVAFDIMEHLDDDVLFLQEIHRVCRGRVLLSVPNADDEQPNRIALTHVHHRDKTHRREYTRDGLAEVVERAGFHVLAIQPNINTALPYFARALAKDILIAKAAAMLISLQCKCLEGVGLFENRCVGDWYCAAEVSS